jgi:hypothetical protein
MLALTLQGYGLNMIRLTVVRSLCWLTTRWLLWLLPRWCEPQPGDNATVDEIARTFAGGLDSSDSVRVTVL